MPSTTEKAKEYYQKNKEKIKARVKLYRQNNAEKVKESIRKCLNDPIKKEKYEKTWKEYRIKNAEKAITRSKEWIQKNSNQPEFKLKRKLRHIKYKEKNQSKINSKEAKRRTAKLLRTPEWVDDEHFWMINEAFELAKLREKIFGIEWHVDHYLPLQGKTVSGFHVITNLQVIPAKLNFIKNNRLVGEKPTSFF